MDSTDLKHLFATFQREAFRFQGLTRYHLGEGEGDFQAYLDGQPLAERDGHPWLAEIAHMTSTGRALINIHLLPTRLTPYLRYTLDWWYAYWSRAGADIRLIGRDAAGSIVDGLPDFWMFDGESTVDMLYDDRGAFLGPVLVTDPAELDRRRLARQSLVERSVRIRAFFADQRAHDVGW